MTAHPLWQKFQKQIWNILLVIYICYIFVSVWIFIMSQSLGNFVPPALDAIKALMVVVAVFMFFIGIVAAVGVYSELYVEDVDGGSQACGRFPVWTLMASVTGLSAFLVVLLMGCAVTTLLMAMNEEDPAASALEHAYGEPELRTEFWETAYCVTCARPGPLATPACFTCPGPIATPACFTYAPNAPQSLGHRMRRAHSRRPRILDGSTL